MNLARAGSPTTKTKGEIWDGLSLRCGTIFSSSSCVVSAWAIMLLICVCYYTGIKLIKFCFRTKKKVPVSKPFCAEKNNSVRMKLQRLLNITCIVVVLTVLVAHVTAETTSDVEKTVETFFRKGGNHTNNWAVLVRIIWCGGLIKNIIWTFLELIQNCPRQV